MFHVIPLNDLKEHEEEGEDCWCHPEVRDDLIIHNSADGREWKELSDTRNYTPPN